MDVELDVIRSFPHCDALVLHAPGECDICDLRPDWQQLRQTWGINFTGGRDVSKSLCPSEQRRALPAINAWEGNRPHPHQPPKGDA